MIYSSGKMVRAVIDSKLSDDQVAELSNVSPVRVSQLRKGELGFHNLTSAEVAAFEKVLPIADLASECETGQEIELLIDSYIETDQANGIGFY